MSGEGPSVDESVAYLGCSNPWWRQSTVARTDRGRISAAIGDLLARWLAQYDGSLAQVASEGAEPSHAWTQAERESRALPRVDTSQRPARTRGVTGVLLRLGYRIHYSIVSHRELVLYISTMLKNLASRGRILPSSRYSRSQQPPPRSVHVFKSMILS